MDARRQQPRFCRSLQESAVNDWQKCFALNPQMLAVSHRFIERQNIDSNRTKIKKLHSRAVTIGVIVETRASLDIQKTFIVFIRKFSEHTLEC